MGCKNQKKYDSFKSKTSEEVDRIISNSPDYQKNFLSKKDEVHIRFGTGEIRSYLTKDSVCLGGNDINDNISNKKICLKNFLFLSAFDLSEDPFKEVEFDGIVGLGFSDLSISKDSNFLDNLYKTRKISNKIFAFYFNKNLFPIRHNNNISKSLNDNEINILKNKKNNKKLSELVIGGIDFNRIKGQIFFNQIISKRYWEVKLDNIYYGDIKLPFCKGKICTAIVDTGTSTLGFSSNFFSVFKSLANLEKNCGNLKSLKPLIFEIGGVFYELIPEDYIIKLKIKGTDDFEYKIPDEKVEAE